MHLSICDMIGVEHIRIFESGSKGENSREVDVSALPAGTYLLQVQAGAQKFRQKFVKN